MVILKGKPAANHFLAKDIRPQVLADQEFLSDYLERSGRHLQLEYFAFPAQHGAAHKKYRVFAQEQECPVGELPGKIALSRFLQEDPHVRNNSIGMAGIIILVVTRSGASNRGSSVFSPVAAAKTQPDPAYQAKDIM